VESSQRVITADAEGCDASCSEVIQEIMHNEPAAVRDEEVAALAVHAQVDEDFATVVKRRLRNQLTQAAPPSSTVWLISFRSGKGELFRKMLLHDKEFKSLRDGLREAHYPLELPPSGTIVLVRPDQYLDTICARSSRTTKRYNVVISGSEEYLMNEVLSCMKSKHRPPENGSEREELDLDVKFVSRWTFLCESPKLLMASPVVQSTTEAVNSNSASSSHYLAHVRGGNPRRHIFDVSGNG